MTFANKLIRGRLKSRVRGLYGGRPYHYWRSLWDRRVLRDMLQETTVGPQRQFPSRVALLFIGTNRYVEFFPRWHSSLQELFLPGTEKTSFIFTDRVDDSCLRAAGDVRVIQTTHEPFPYVNLLKFKIINQAATALREFSHIVYVDADMYATSQVTEEEFFHHDRSLFSVQHYNYVRRTSPDAFERRPVSRAAVGVSDDLSTYWQSCFWGGRSGPFLEMTHELERLTDEDIKRGVVALWWDESFLNKYLIESKSDVHTYPPSYAWPQYKPAPVPLPPKLVHAFENPPSLRHTPSIRGGVRKNPA